MQLEKGMNIYAINGMCGILKYTINHTTPKFAVVKNGNVEILRFKRDVNGTLFRSLGGGVWDATHYEIESPDIIERLNRQTLIRKALRVDIKGLSNEQLETIVKMQSQQTKEA